MIKEKQAKAFCCEDISLIENYELAVADKTQKWDCHHRNGILYSRDDLKAMGLYWKRPASELIFIPHPEHTRLHWLGKHHTAETRANMSKSHKGKQFSEEHKTNISKSKTGIKHPQARAVHQIDKNTGVIIKKWNYIREAARALDIHDTVIVRCCKGKAKSAGGYVWKYADELDKIPEFSN